ncbi:phage tail family protein [Geobacillus stearothermophilus]|uniref:phage tail family protein n=1 Tax=Geobacillus stearothermophilus TaxID=1422 RepID=UPI002E20016D|nr:phage tail family protein [Geobacillus stearothermophilus]
MQRIIFTNSRGQSVELKNSAPFLLQSIDGLGDVDAEVQTQKAPFRDGSTYIDSVLQERAISLEVVILADKSTLLEKRQYLASVFNPKLGKGVLRYENGETIREIEAVPDGVPVFPSGRENRGLVFQKALVNLLCPNPFWKSTEITEEPTFEPLFSFPFEGMFQIGIQRDARIIVNDGDAPAPLQIEFHGPAVNPIIINKTTGEFIKVNQTLGENEIMKIDTTPGRKSVCFIQPDGTERNVFNWIDPESTFFQLVVGENEIEYSADSDIQGAIVNISHRKLYNAV